VKKNEVQFHYITGRQDQFHGSCPLLWDGKMFPKLYCKLRREERVVLESESKIKGEKKIFVGNVVERRNLCYYREFIWRKGNSV